MFSKLPMFQRVGSAAYKKDLTNITALCDYLGNPQNQYRTIHVAGTNGKGSVSHLLSAVFQEHGFKTGLYVSPHYKDYRERIKINGIYVPKSFVIDFIDRLKPLIEQVQPSFFEINVAMAFEYFKQRKVDIAVIETGLGGRLDSTNIINPDLSVITNISFDHMNLLGNTLKEIAFEKAGIIKAGVPVIIGEKQEEVKEVFSDKSIEFNAPILFASDLYSVKTVSSDPFYSYFDLYKKGIKIAGNVPFNLHGTFQEKNIATVLGTIDVYNEQALKSGLRPIKFDAFLNAAKNLKQLTKFMGRWHVLNQNPMILCDSGHNESGIAYVVEQLNNMVYDRLHFVLGAVNDKDIDKMLNQLPSNARYYFCKANIPRGLGAEELKNQASKYGLNGRTYSSVKNALKAAKSSANKNDLVFIGGSTFVVAEVL